MKPHPISLITALLLLSFFSSAQVQQQSQEDPHRFRLQLISGSFTPQKNITTDKIAAVNRQTVKVKGQSVLVVQFEQLPSAQERNQLKQSGIELLDYISGNAYLASVKGELNTDLLKRNKARAVISLLPEQKMLPRLAQGIFPAWAVKTPGTVELWVSFPRSFSFETVNEELRARNFDITSTIFQSYHVLALRIASDRLKELAALPFIEYVQAIPKEDVALNNKSMAMSKANVLRFSGVGGRNLSGEGVTVGVGDDSNPLAHIDFSGRVINRAAAAGAGHGIHVMGTVAGAGIRDERYSGYAPKSTVVAQTFSNILVNVADYVQDHGMVITNNSYGNVVDDCETFGIYDLYSRVMDQQAFRFPNLQHVFAAGNSGAYNCSPYLSGYSNVLGGYQSSKNTITVGNMDELNGLSPSSSKGPVRDGRIKPEIAALGTRVVSTWPVNTYSYSSGTSMASPAVAGGLALLYQRYRQLNGDANPKNGLMKALVCNGAADVGNTGPDYGYGFGSMDLLRSVKMLENNNYFISSVAADASKTHTLTIPAGSSIAQLKVMLYWNDSAAAVLANQTLVNDLDLEVNDAASVLHLPQLLDTVPGNVSSIATTGADHINNIEQVVINNPAAGTYTFKVKGTRFPLSSEHEYYLVFDTIPVAAALNYPLGGEHFAPGDSVYISWDAYGNAGNDFALQYSIDNGGNWISINNNVAAGLRQYKWFIPAAIASYQMKVRLIQNGTGVESSSGAFTVLPVPVSTQSSVQCEGYIAIQWPALTGITDYEILISTGKDMVPIATTTANNYTVSGLSKDSTYYVAVRARLDGNPGRRALANVRQPNGGTCAGAISNNDLKIDAILAPLSGRRFTARALTTTSRVSIRIKNLDNAVTSGNITASYIIGTNPPVTETIVAPNINALATYTYTFTTPVDLSAVGSYDVQVRIAYAGDPVFVNDTLVSIVKQMDNPFIDLANDFLDDIETAPVLSFTSRQVGLPGLDRYDFVGSTVNGRIRSFINSGIAYSGNRALTLDADRYNAGGTTDSLTGTFNLLGYDEATEDIRFDFMYKHHGQLSNAANRVWIRGNDQRPWIPVYDLYANQTDPGLFKRSSSIELSDVLAANAQQFGSSFQIRWGQWGQILASDNKNAAGYTFDDIRIYRVSNDIQMLSIDTPVVASCGLGTAVPVRIAIRNSANTMIASVPVHFQIDGQTSVTETIPSIAGNTTILYTFTTTANLSGTGEHTVKTWVDLAVDNFSDNDTVTITLNNPPVISSFPYLQDFEGGNGSWYTNGKNNSWQYGTPASSKIKRAASGSKAWKTSLAGNYNDGELSYLYSPCFDITGMSNPTLSFSLAIDLEDCGASLCDAGYLEYSADGRIWSRLGAVGEGVNWYNKNYSGSQVWSVQNYTRWHVATIPLPVGLNLLRIRFVMASDPYVSKEGIAIDDIHIYNNPDGMYTATPYVSAVVNQPSVNGNNWIDFKDAGKLIASVNPNGQNMGSTDLQAFISNGFVRSYNDHYYHDRNIVIKPAVKKINDSATVRFYFSDLEMETMLNATDCGTCVAPTSAYELGVAKYSDPDGVTENGTLADNTGSNWVFISPSLTRIVPFDIGYYAEFKVKRFSEFWLSKGRLDNNEAPAAQLLDFTAVKTASNDVLTEWTTNSEFNIDGFEVELARSNEDFNQNRFVKIGEISSQGNAASPQQYSFTDVEVNKTGVRYYRLKTIGIDGSISYSAVRAIVFTDELTVQVYPNPSQGVFNLVYQLNEGESFTAVLYDVNGRRVAIERVTGTGFVQKTEMDLTSAKFAPGLYLMEISGIKIKKTFRLLKQ